MKWLLVLKERLKDILGESKGCGKPTRKTWWGNTELQATIKLKREAKREAKCRLNVGLMINYITSWG